MTGLVQTSSEETRPEPRPLWLLVWTLLVLGTELTSGGAEHSLFLRMSLNIFIYCFYHLSCLWNNFYGLSALVDCWFGLCKEDFFDKFLNLCPFDYAAFAVSRKVWIPLTGLSTPVGWLSLPQLTVLSWSAIIV